MKSYSIPTKDKDVTNKEYVDDVSPVVEDTTPQLGGDLDTNGHDILFGSDTISGTGSVITGDHGTATDPEIVNTIYGTGDAPTTSGGEYPIGTVYIKYTV